MFEANTTNQTHVSLGAAFALSCANSSWHDAQPEVFTAMKIQRRYLTASLHGVTTQKTATLVLSRLVCYRQRSFLNKFKRSRSVSNLTSLHRFSKVIKGLENYLCLAPRCSNKYFWLWHAKTIRWKLNLITCCTKKLTAYRKLRWINWQVLKGDTYIIGLFTFLKLFIVSETIRQIGFKLFNQV